MYFYFVFSIKAQVKHNFCRKRELKNCFSSYSVKKLALLKNVLMWERNGAAAPQPPLSVSLSLCLCLSLSISRSRSRTTPLFPLNIQLQNCIIKQLRFGSADARVRALMAAWVLHDDELANAFLANRSNFGLVEVLKGRSISVTENGLHLNIQLNP